MKHRTVTVFIMVVASLAATPQAFRQLTSLKDAAGARLNAGIWGAFMSLNGQRVDAAARAQVLPTAAESSSPAAFELAARGPRAARAETRAPRGGERAVRRAAEEIEVKNFELTFGGKEVAALERLAESRPFEIGQGGRLMVRTPEMPAGVAVPLPAAYHFKSIKGQAIVRGAGDVWKGLEVYRARPRRLVKESVKKADEAERVTWAVRAEAHRAAEEALKAEPPCPTRGASARLNCETEVEELTH